VSATHTAGAHLLGNYARAPVTFVSGEGCELIDADGRRYLDFVAGIAVCALGHAHPEIAKAVARQASTLVQCSNYYGHEPAGRLADKLCEITGFDRAFFCNSGSEANEAAIKLARKRAFRRGESRAEIVACSGSFHGRTLGALAATDNARYQEGFAPLPLGFRFTPFNDVERLARAVTEKTAALLIEPIQGESGIHPADADFLQAARAACDAAGALLIFDEIQCGTGRTGRFFAFEHANVRPDVVTLAKALANGLPIGAMLVAEHVADALQPGDHGTTFGGSPIPCAAALRHLELRESLRLDDHVRRMGALLSAALTRLYERFPDAISMPRGMGLMQGVTVDSGIEIAAIVDAMRERGVLVICAGRNSLRFVPPLLVQPEHVQTLERAMEDVLGEIQAPRS